MRGTRLLSLTRTELCPDALEFHAGRGALLCAGYELNAETRVKRGSLTSLRFDHQNSPC